MEKAKLIIDLIGKVIWPLVVLIIILIFRKPIVMLLSRVKKFKAGGIELTMDKKIKGIIEETLENKLKEDTSENFKKIVFQNMKDDEESVTVEASTAGNTTLLAFTANQSFRENLKYDIYYDPANRNHSLPFKYLGLYEDKTVKAIGKVTNIAYCDLEDNELVGTNGFDIKTLSENEYRRIKSIIQNTKYYDLSEGIKFYLVEKFHVTKYSKISFSSLRAKRYFWLDEIEGFRPEMTAEQIANLLDGKVWE